MLRKWLLSLYRSIFCKISGNNKNSTYSKYSLINWKDTHQIHKGGYLGEYKLSSYEGKILSQLWMMNTCNTNLCTILYFLNYAPPHLQKYCLKSKDFTLHSIHETQLNKKWDFWKSTEKKIKMSRFKKKNTLKIYVL